MYLQVQAPAAGTVMLLPPQPAGVLAGVAKSGVDPIRLRYPKGGPLSPVLATTYPNPRWIYLGAFFFWFSITVLRWCFVFGSKPVRNIILYWNALDCFLLLTQVLWVAWHLLVSHHRWRYLEAEPYGDVEATEITHVLCVLHATESPQTLYNMVADLRALPCEGKKILLIGMEKVTPDVEEKMATIRELYGEGFDQILYTVHTLRNGEIVGTGSNHFECQVAVQAYLASMGDNDTSNVIFSKFDCNMRLDKDQQLLNEIESVWCMVDPETRFGITFMPNLYWSADKKDRLRNCMEKFTSFSMSTLLQQSSFAMAFVSGSLDGVCAAGYTPPSLLAEDDLTFSKKQALLPKPRTYRLCSCILKVFDSDRDFSKKDWTCAFLDKKMKRWMMGHVEKDAYFWQWLCCRCSLVDFRDPHPAVRNKCRTFILCIASFLRMYLIFALPLNVTPFVLTYGQVVFNTIDFRWLRLFAILPDNVDWLQYSVPLGLTTGESFWKIPEAFFVFFGYWCLMPAAIISVSIMIRIQVRIYRSFRFLKFNWRTLLLYPLIFFPVLLLMGPLFLLYSYLRHGILNLPAGHMAMTKAGADSEDTEDSEDQDGEA